ncbi:hypothetical protein KCP76_16525 [Salmonella enterica subsp. enterica serovar Weltevreden]|nr:hypothetical protein KCP76_16525 [Salmonella enterica subsp. enterica serovar Weltevreden]
MVSIPAERWRRKRRGLLAAIWASRRIPEHHHGAGSGAASRPQIIDLGDDFLCRWAIHPMRLTRRYVISLSPGSGARPQVRVLLLVDVVIGFGATASRRIADSGTAKACAARAGDQRCLPSQPSPERNAILSAAHPKQKSPRSKMPASQ